jgi:hypothetical protein
MGDVVQRCVFDREPGKLKKMGGMISNIMGAIKAPSAARKVAEANIAAEHGVLGAVGDAQKRLEPYQAAGEAGIGELQNYALNRPDFKFNPDDFMNSPAYKFEQEQGINAIENSSAARGMGMSGNTLKELTRFGQGLASTYYDSAFNKAANTFNINHTSTLQDLMSLINPGLSATSESNKLGLAGAEDAGNYAVGAGRARAGGILSQARSIGGIADNVMSMAGGMFGPGGPEWMPDIGGFGAMFGNHP